MAIVVDATSTSPFDASATTTITVAHTVAADADFLLVGIGRGNGTNALTLSAPAWNGASMGSAIGDVGSGGPARMEVYKLVAPATGTHNFTATLSATDSNGRIVVIVRSYKGVDQTTPHGTVVTNNFGGAPTPATVTLNVSSAADELVSDFIYNWVCTGLTAGAGQTDRANLADFSGGSYGGSSDEGGAGTVTMSWSALADYREAAQIGIPLKPAASATLEQEGFRWYEDNGSESGSSASAAQDTNITAAAGATKRLRMLVNATGDPATKQFKLQWKKSGGSWADVL